MAVNELNVSAYVQCDVDLLRRGMERAAMRVGLSVTEQVAHAALIVRAGSGPVEDFVAGPVLTVDDGAVRVATTHALDPTLWAAVGRLANEILGRGDDDSGLNMSDRESSTEVRGS